MENIHFINHPWVVLGVAFISWPIYKRLAKVFFGEHYQKFAKALHYSFQADFHSLLKGKYWEDWDQSFKLKLFVMLCFGWVFAVSELLLRV